jgi:hypothetical protein
MLHRKIRMAPQLNLLLETQALPIPLHPLLLLIQNQLTQLQEMMPLLPQVVLLDPLQMLILPQVVKLDPLKTFLPQVMLLDPLQMLLLPQVVLLDLQVHLLMHPLLPIKQLPASRLLLRRLNLLKNCLNHPNSLQTNHFKVLAMAIFLQFNPQQIEYCRTKLTQFPLTIISITFLMAKLQAKHLQGI